MRHIHRLLAAVLPVAALFCASCTKTASSAIPGGCITQYQPDISQRMISVAQYDSAKTYFSANGLSLDTLQPLSFFYSGTDSLGHGAYYQVPVRKLVNGLPVQNAYLRYDFFNGINVYRESTGYDYPIIEKDTTPHLSLGKVRELFLASNPDSYATFGNLVAVPSHPTHWADSCIVATLQYTDKANLDCCAPGEHGFVKTWSVQAVPETRPLAIVVDETEKVIPTIIYTATNGGTPGYLKMPAPKK